MAIDTRRDGTDLQEDVKWGQQEFERLRGDFSSIASDLTNLARKETELARAEMSEQFSALVRTLAFGAAALLASALALMFVFLTLMYMLDTGMPRWVAALLTTLIVAGVAAIAGALAYQQFRKITVVPQRTLRSVQEDVRWAREQMRSSVR